MLAPRINAAGRMGKAELAAELFLTKDPVRAQALAAELCEQNKLRQNEENKILEQTLTRLRREYNPLEDKIIVLAGEGWHQGVIGIVCSRLCDRYGCPVVLISVDEDGVGKGSGLSIGSFNLFEALTSCEDLFERYGGHALAAGLTVQADRIEELRTRPAQVRGNACHHGGARSAAAYRLHGTVGVADAGEHRIPERTRAVRHEKCGACVLHEEHDR